MSSIATIAALGGVICVAGLAMLGAWARGLSPSRKTLPTSKSGSATARRRRLLMVVGSAAAGLATWAITGWPVLGLGAAAAVIGLPPVVLVGRRNERAIARLQALEEWTRRLADSLAAGVAPTAAVVRSADRAPLLIRPEVRQLASRLATSRWDKRAALRAFADRMDDATADLVVHALDVTLSSRSSTQLSVVLLGAANDTASEVEHRREVETARSSPRAESMVLVLLSVVVIVVVLVFNIFDVRAAYNTPMGQVALALILVMMALALYLIVRFSRGESRPRLIAQRSGADEVKR